MEKQAVNQGIEVLEKVALKGAENKVINTTLITTSSQFSKHATILMAERGITMKMVEKGINRWQRFYDPLNKSINYIYSKGFASAKSLLIAVNPITGEITTVLRSSKNLIKPRMIPIK